MNLNLILFIPVSFVGNEKLVKTHIDWLLVSENDYIFFLGIGTILDISHAYGHMFTETLIHSL